MAQQTEMAFLIEESGMVLAVHGIGILLRAVLRDVVSLAGLADIAVEDHTAVDRDRNAVAHGVYLHRTRLGRTAQARKSYDAAIRCGGLPDSDLELAITGTTTLPRKKQAADQNPASAAKEDGPQLAAAISDPSAIPHDANEVPAHVAEDPNAQEKPSAGPKQVVVSHRPETEPAQPYPAP